ncbi:hypothetical protein DC3_47140 [Deinococcus cellulosilyticus NBRC 106333 = KACC 11606]|uniref:Uncharacterized protein n=1 Tax=Deinococcus cellulosilyticus (strain DSM 18568 / NBRC 106333 / KACC 11606 / 5516J-15) TaxID=1223518 RepID=A0A511N8B0_DEIC1|nr:hypothetical protein DC3_47140 [Deinococcus cellulosilyticus NBRC 106333 = KACC 11606]
MKRFTKTVLGSGKSYRMQCSILFSPYPPSSNPPSTTVPVPKEIVLKPMAAKWLGGPHELFQGPQRQHVKTY